MSRPAEPERPLPDFLAGLGVTFAAEFLPLFEQAVTHRSFAFERGGSDNERLEFLGDAVLAAIVSEHLYAEHPDLSEGELSKLRARVVSRTALGKRAAEMGLGAALRLGVGERKDGGEKRLTNLGSALEAVIGAIFLASGFEAARAFVAAHVIAQTEFRPEEAATHGDYKSALQEWTQKELGILPEYRRVGDSGPDHDKRFVIEVWLAGKYLARAEARKIKEAQNRAAREAYFNVIKNAER